jgi:hypothetical protein
VQINAPTAATAPSPSAGVIVSRDARENDDGTWNTTIRSDTSPVLSIEEKTFLKHKTITGTGTRNDRSEPSDPIRGPTEKVTFRKTQNEDGTWDHITIVDAATGGLTAGGGVVNGCKQDLGQEQSQLSITEEQKNAAYDAAYNGIPDVARMVWSERQNEDGTWDFSYRYEVPPQLLSKSATARAKGGFSETIKRNVKLEELETFPPTTPPIGETVTLRQDKNADCGWDEIKRIETAPGLQGDVNILRADQSVSVTREQNSQTRDDDLAADPNTVLQVTNDENPDGTWNKSRSVTTPIPQAWPGSYETNGRTANVTIFKNYTGLQVIALANGFNPAFTNSLTATPNEFGLFDGSATSIADSSSGSGSSGSETPRTTTYTVRVAGFTYIYSSKLTSFESTAASWVNESSDFTDAQWKYLAQKPEYNYIGKGKYLAWKVTVS